MDVYRAYAIESIAFPLLGAQNGRLAPRRSLEIMISYLADCSIPVEIFRKPGFSVKIAEK